MQVLRFLLKALIAVAASNRVSGHAFSANGTPLLCGTMDLNSKLTRHCFPATANRHMVCCADIQLPDPAMYSGSRLPHNTSSFHNILESRIRSVSRPESYSWCTCSIDVCENQLGGKVQWILQPDGSTISPLGSTRVAQPRSEIVTPDLLKFATGSEMSLEHDLNVDFDRAAGHYGRIDFSAGRARGTSVDAMIAEKEEEVIRLLQSNEAAGSDSTEEIDLGDKLRPLTKEQVPPTRIANGAIALGGRMHSFGIHSFGVPKHDGTCCPPRRWRS
jgi:hypothetical protein